MHKLRMVMQSVSLYDELVFSPISENRIVISSNEPAIINNNIIEKAYFKLKELFPEKVRYGFTVEVTKNIPLGAGLAGGSSNAAATVAALLLFFDIRLSKKEVIDLNLSIGSDVNFCYYGGTRLVGGIGERLERIDSPYQHFLLVFPHIHVSTKEAFRLWDLQAESYVPRAESDSALGGLFYNAFEKVLYPMYPELANIKNILRKLGAIQALMTGSGSTVFGVFSNQEECVKASKDKALRGLKVFVVKKKNQGISILNKQDFTG